MYLIHNQLMKDRILSKIPVGTMGSTLRSIVTKTHLSGGLGLLSGASESVGSSLGDIGESGVAA